MARSIRGQAWRAGHARVPCTAESSTKPAWRRRAFPARSTTTATTSCAPAPGGRDGPPAQRARHRVPLGRHAPPVHHEPRGARVHAAALLLHLHLERPARVRPRPRRARRRRRCAGAARARRGTARSARASACPPRPSPPRGPGAAPRYSQRRAAVAVDGGTRAAGGVAGRAVLARVAQAHAQRAAQRRERGTQREDPAARPQLVGRLRPPLLADREPAPPRTASPARRASRSPRSRRPPPSPARPAPPAGRPGGPAGGRPSASSSVCTAICPATSRAVRRRLERRRAGRDLQVAGGPIRRRRGAEDARPEARRRAEHERVAPVGQRAAAVVDRVHLGHALGPRDAVEAALDRLAVALERHAPRRHREAAVGPRVHHLHHQAAHARRAASCRPPLQSRIVGLAGRLPAASARSGTSAMRRNTGGTVSGTLRPASSGL